MLRGTLRGMLRRTPKETPGRKLRGMPRRALKGTLRDAEENA